MTAKRRLVPDRWLLAVVAAALVHALVTLALTTKGLSLPPDSGQYAEVARSLVRGKGYTINFTEFHAGLLDYLRHPPELHGLLAPLFIAPLFLAFGPDEALVRIPSILFLSCLAVLTFVCARRRFGNVAGCFAAVIVLARPYLGFSALAGDDGVAAAVFAMSAFLCFQNGIESTQGRWFWAAGVMAGLGTLQKFTGVVLPFVLLVAALSDRSARAAIKRFKWMTLFVPVGLAVALYVLRNYAVHGGPGFRFSPIDWLSKDDPMAYFAFYQRAPSLAEVFAQLGPHRVLELIAKQLGFLGREVIGDPLIAGGLVALLLLRQYRVFVVFVLGYSLSLGFVICVAYHMEVRYFTPLLPFLAVALGAVCGMAWERGKKLLRNSPLVRRVLASAVAVGASMAVLPPLKVARDAGRVMNGKPPCADSAAFIRRSTDANSVILTSNPWFVSWRMERPAVMAPTNGDEAIVTVANHYRTDWALAGAHAFWVTDLALLFAMPGRARDYLAPELVFSDPDCSVYRLHRRDR